MNKYIIVLSLIIVLIANSCKTGKYYEVVFENGMVIDGTGKPAFAANIGVKEGKIFLLTSDENYSPDTVIDISGKYIAPGFIDARNRSDLTAIFPEYNSNENFLRQGITTVIGGADGYLTPSLIAVLKDSLSELGAGTNIGVFVGHNAIRAETMKTDYKYSASQEQIDYMKALVEEGMEMGALGISSNLLIQPADYASFAELVQLGESVKKYDGVFEFFGKEQNSDILNTLSFQKQLAEETGLKVVLGHFNAVGLHNSGKIEAFSEALESALENNLKLYTTQAPYNAEQVVDLRSLFILPSSLFDFYPDPNKENFDQGLTDTLLMLLDKPVYYDRIKAETEGGEFYSWVRNFGYGSFVIHSNPMDPSLEGQYLLDLAEIRGQEPFDIMVDLFHSFRNSVSLKVGAVKDADIEQLIVKDWNMIGTDGGYVDEYTSAINPAACGAFSRLLYEYSIKKKLLSLEEAVKKCTSVPAELLGLDKLGRIQTGMQADLVVFDIDHLKSDADYDNLNRYSEGFSYVMVNGHFVIKENKLTLERPGKFIGK